MVMKTKDSERMRFEFTKRMYIVVMVLNILAIIGLAYLITLGYSIEYPRFFFGSLSAKTYIILFIVFLLPLIASLIGILRLNSVNYVRLYGLKNVLSVLILLICICLSIASSCFLFAIPPVESFTDATENYLKVGADVQKHEDVYLKFFPKKIPSDATTVKYSYRKYVGLFERNVIISASWSLPEDSYEYYKKLIQDNFSLSLIQNNRFQIDLNNDNSSFDPNLVFEYSDATHELYYLAVIEK